VVDTVTRIDAAERSVTLPEAYAKNGWSFVQACLAGDRDGLMSLLAQDVTVWSDGGGKVSGAARQPIQGRDRGARAMIGNAARAPDGTSLEVIETNGLPTLLIRIWRQVVGVLTFEVRRRDYKTGGLKRCRWAARRRIRAAPTASELRRRG